MKFINLSNHPSSKWDEVQLAAARKYGDIIDVPFPAVDPHAEPWDIAELAGLTLHNIMCTLDGEDAVMHVMGEMTFVVSFVQQAANMQFLCVASTTERNTVENPDGTKTVSFRFVQFRKYNV